MPAYIVTYDLLKQGQNYKCIIDKLKGYGTHWHAQESVWIIVTQQTAVQIRDHLTSCLDANDKLFVAKLEGEAAWQGYTVAIGDWLRKQL